MAATAGLLEGGFARGFIGDMSSQGVFMNFVSDLSVTSRSRVAVSLWWNGSSSCVKRRVPAGGGGDPIRLGGFEVASLGPSSISSNGNGPKDTRLSDLCLLVLLNALFHGFAVAASTRVCVLGKRAVGWPTSPDSSVEFLKSDRNSSKLSSSFPAAALPATTCAVGDNMADSALSVGRSFRWCLVVLLSPLYLEQCDSESDRRLGSGDSTLTTVQGLCVELASSFRTWASTWVGVLSDEESTRRHKSGD